MKTSENRKKRSQIEKVKRCFLFFVVLILLIGTLTACGTTTNEEGGTKTFTDSLGRKVELPENITKVAVTGSLAQMMVFAIAPEKMVGLATKWDGVAREYLNKEYYNLPVLGQLYGGKGNLNLETLLAASPDIIIDMGEPKDELALELDELQDKVDIPIIHISCDLTNYDQAFLQLGKILDKEKEGKSLSDYCSRIYSTVLEMMENVGNKKKSVIFCTGEAGVNVIAKDSYHAELIDLMTDNVAVIENPTSKGIGDEVGLEQILIWNPDIILFNNPSYYEGAKTDIKWGELSAIQKGTFYEVPFGPYNWAGTPPSVQRYLGMLWLGELLYKDYVTYDLKEEVRSYYELFYHYELKEEQFISLMKNSIGKVQ